MEIIGGKDGNKQLVLRAPIYQGWYNRSQVGMHHRMKAVQDYGFPQEAVVVLHVLLERERKLATLDADKRMEVSHLACFVFLGYVRALRGEEITKIELTRILKHF
jgi:hypothetical protein